MLILKIITNSLLLSNGNLNVLFDFAFIFILTFHYNVAINPLKLIVILFTIILVGLNVHQAMQICLSMATVYLIFITDFPFSIPIILYSH
jgi:hypothetical protein